MLHELNILIKTLIVLKTYILQNTEHKLENISNLLRP